MHTDTQAGGLYYTNHITCRFSVVYFSQVYRDSIWSSVLVKSVIHTRFGHIFQLSLLYRLDQNRQPKSILVEYVRQTLFASLFQSSLNPCFNHEFYQSLSRDNRFTGLYISRVYYLQRGRQTYFACLFFDPTSLLSESIVVKFITGHIQAGNQRHSNDWPNMYQSSLIYLEREK